jgi:hypothetical protein
VARELFARFDMDHRCSASFAAGSSISTLAWSESQGSIFAPN